MLQPDLKDPAFQPLWAHQSQNPSKWSIGLIEGLRDGRIPHKYHYDSPKQVDRWLKLHEAYSPARQEISAQTIYQDAILSSLERAQSQGQQLPEWVIGLGCGGGWKDKIAVDAIEQAGIEPKYLAVDVGPAMTWTAVDFIREAEDKSQWGKSQRLTAALTIDLEKTLDWGKVFDAWRGQQQRDCACFTLFGMVPNWEPAFALKGLATAMRPNDLAWVSFNLGPDTNPQRGAEKVLSQYENEATESWLRTLLEDMDFPMNAGSLQWSIQLVNYRGLEVRRIQCDFVFSKDQVWTGLGESWNWKAGAKIRLFFSCRYTVEQARELIRLESVEENFDRSVQWKIDGEWISASGEEGVFAIRAESP
jgi:L-histidine Nalpha-methyltransferase